MSNDFSAEGTSMEKKIVFAAKGPLSQLDGSRQRQDSSNAGGGNQVSSAFAKSRSQRRSRRGDPQGAHGVVNFRPEPSSQKYTSSKGGRKGKGVEELSDQVDEKDSDGTNQSRPAEFGSLQLPGIKKQNLNHLLNFHFTPREPHGRGSGGGPHFHHSSRTNVRSKQMHESFIQANCQFVVASDEDIEYYQVDLPINWKSVEQIIIRTYGGTPACPICLCSPSAAKITKCGHIFCWSCILRYFSYGDRRNSHPCPICFQMINPVEIKSVVANLLDEIHVGDVVKMQLVCRKKDCSPLGSMSINSKLGRRSVEDWEKRFQKFLRLTPEQVKAEVLAREHLELTLQLDTTIESLETEFVMAAMTELNNRTKLLLDKIILVSPNANTRIPTESVPPQERDTKQNILESSIELENQELANAKGINWDDYACFYQAADGSNVYLTPLNTAMLWKGFGPNPDEWPQTLDLRVVEIELLTVTPELRKRFKFLQFVPLNSCIQLLEVDLKGTVAKDVVGEFSYQLNERKRRRSERARVEKRRDRKNLEAERMTNLGPQKPMIESLQDFPECRSPEAEAQALEYAIQASLAETDADENRRRSEPMACSSSKSSDCLLLPDLSSHRPCPSVSFAQALNNPFHRKPRTVTASFPIKTAISDSNLSRSSNSENQVDSDEGQIPAFRASVSDAIASAFANFTLQEHAGGETEQSSGQKKKGRKKGKVLFATAMGMGSN